MMMAASKGAAKDKQTSEKHDDLAKEGIKVRILSLSCSFIIADFAGKHFNLG
jgi:hypothetical protein